MKPISPKHIAVVDLLDRQETSVLLFAKLGGKFKWHQWLCQWALAEHDGLKGTRLALQPFALEHREPRYLRSDIDSFIESAQLLDKDLNPEKFAPTTFEIDARVLDLSIPWKLRRVQRCAHKTTATSTLP